MTGDIEEYEAAAGDFLRSRPVKNTVLVTVLELLRARGSMAYGDGPPMLGWWSAAGCVAGAFMHTPPYPVLLSVMPGRAVTELAATLAPGGSLPGVTARSQLAEAFATGWRSETGTDFRIWERRRLYRLAAPRPPATRGQARPARPDDRHLLLDWYDDAENEIRVRPGDHAAAVDDRIAYGGVTLWEVDGAPVALAGRTRMVAGMVRIAPVYTPIEHRGHGYAAAVTASVSQAALDAGVKEIVSFTDLANPATNSIYQRIGYQPLDDFLVISFTP